MLHSSPVPFSIDFVASNNTNSLSYGFGGEVSTSVSLGSSHGVGKVVLKEPPLRDSGETLSPCLLQLLETTHLPWLLASSSNHSPLLFPAHLLLTQTLLLSSWEAPCDCIGFTWIIQKISPSQDP